MESRDERLAAMHPRLIAVYQDDGTLGEGIRPSWTRVNNFLYYHETTIDLSGYAQEELSFFPTGVGVQDPGIHLFIWHDPAQEGTSMQVLDIVTSVPLNPQEVSDACLVSAVGPTMIGSDLEFSPVMLGLYRYFTPRNNTSIVGLQSLERSQRFDSAEPTAADKLYCYRIAACFVGGIPGAPSPGDYIWVPAARQLIGGVMAKEDSLVHLMRMKRSYELANQV